MNGRIYDPTLGRFLQADPFIQAPKNSQNYNRYSYVLNNPMSYTDPSGYFFASLFKGVRNFWQATVGSALRAIAKVPILNAALGFLACSTGPLGCAIFSAASTYAVTGSLKSAVIGAFTAGIGGGQGFLTAGLIGGLASRAQGGNFGYGFWSAGIGALVGGKIKTGNAYMNVVVSAVIGGTVSKLTGGKFANGAQTWAFSAAMAQDWGSRNKDGYNTGPVELSDAERDDIDTYLMVLEDELDVLNKSGYFKDPKSAAGWLHDNVHPLSIEYDMEIGARIFTNLGLNGEYALIGDLVTDYAHDYISDISLSKYGRLVPVAEWHSHGASNVTFTDPEDLVFARAKGYRAAFVSRGAVNPQGNGIVSMDYFQNGNTSTICKQVCNF